MFRNNVDDGTSAGAGGPYQFINKNEIHVSND